MVIFQGFMAMAFTRPSSLCCIMFLLCLLMHRSNAQTGCIDATEQPVVTSIDPPSGTTGDSDDLSTLYTITGERMDQVSDIVAEIQTFGGVLEIETQDIVATSTSIEFRFVSVNSNLPRPEGGTIVNLMIRPTNPNCSIVIVEIALHPTINVLLAVSTQAQAGTTIATGFGSCLPSACGDNNTEYELTVGGVSLDLISVTSDSFVARFPEFDPQFVGPGAVFVISTQYQSFSLAISLEFELFLQTTDAVVSPAQGQRGTRLTITGTNLLGYPGRATSLSSVTIGGIEASIISIDDVGGQERIELRARMGPAGISSISINTTQQINGEMYDGPYTFLEDAWTYLEEGVISDIIPPAVQSGGMVTLCGSRLLGGGSTIDELLLAGVASTVMTSVPFPSPSVGDECVTAQVPSAVAGASGVVVMMADTGAIVESTTNFTFAEITEIFPNRGQAGTSVVIRGFALLSGLDGLSPTVTLSGVEATVITASSTEISVSTNDPIDGAIIGTAGGVEISVTSSGTVYTVSSNTQTWTYEAPGEIETVSPRFGQVGTLLSITGTNLLSYGSSISRATVGGMDAMIIGSGSDSLVRLRAPNGAIGNTSIELFSDNGASVRADDVFEFREPGSIAQVTPNIGQSGTFVTITGTNLFGYGDNVVSVTFGEIPATIDFTQSNSSSISVRIQPNLGITSDTPVTVSIVGDTMAVVDNAMWTYLVQGQVADIQPPIGQQGTRVTITGTNLLGGGTSVAELFIDDILATVEDFSDTSIDAVMGRLEDNRPTTNPGEAFIMSDTGAIVTGGTYSHQAPGHIDDFVPKEGREGTFITITGENLLGFGESVTNVYVVIFPANIISANSTVIVVRAIDGTPFAEGTIIVEINTGAMICSMNNFLYGYRGSVSQLIPTSGSEGTGLLINGTYLVTLGSLLDQVTIGGNKAQIIAYTTDVISVIVGPAPASNRSMAEIIITAQDGSFVRGVFFEFIDLRISLPGLTSGREGTRIEITLPAEFDPNGGLRALIDNVEGQIVSSSSSQIVVAIPRARQAGMYTVDVAVENSDKSIARLSNAFTYLPEGLIFSVTPNSGQRGTNVVLEGENILGGGGEISMASIGNIAADVFSSTDMRVELQISANPAEGTVFPLIGDILLEADTGARTIRLAAFTFVQPGRILSIQPFSGQAGTRVEITGSDLLRDGEAIQSVLIAGVSAMVIGTPTDTEIVVEAMPSAVTSGPIEIVLDTGAIITDSDILFEYIEPGMISSAIPNSGTEGTRVLLQGSSLLGGGERVDRVVVGGVEAVIESAFNENITVRIQPSEPFSAGTVEVISNTGARIVREELWTYTEKGRINAIEPPVGQQGIEVELSGVGLLGRSGNAIEECTLAGIQAEVVMMRSSVVVCRAGFFPDLVSDPSSGTGPAEITTNTGVVINSGVNLTFTYYVAEIQSLSRQSGNNGTIVQISGMNLFGFPSENSTIDSIRFGEVEAAVVNAMTNDITVRVGLSPSATTDETVRITSSVGSFLELENAWSYSEPGLIIAVTPSIGFAGDTIIISGENLSPPNANSVRVIVGQTSSSEATIVNSTTIEFVAGVYQSSDAPEEELPVQIVFDTGEIVSEPSVTFAYNSTPGIIETVTPVAGMEGTLVLITGRNLVIGNDTIEGVLLAGVAAEVRFRNNSEQLELTAGAGPVQGAFGTIVITTSSGLQFGLAGNAWRYYPIIDSSHVSPNSGQTGTIVIIDLSSFDPLPDIQNVNLTDFPVSGFSVGPNNQLTVTANILQTEAQPIGDIIISFTDLTQLVIPNSWQFLPAVEINTVSPTNLLCFYNTQVIMDGANFQAGGVTVTSVTVAGATTVIESQTDNQLVVRITEQFDTSSLPMTGPVVITSSEGATYTSSSTFTYLQVQVNSLSPREGQRGTLVNITGESLLLGGAGLTGIVFGGISSSFSSESNSEIIARAGESAMESNITDITYTVDTGAEFTITDSWRYITPGEITSVTPEEGNLGTIVTIMGVNLFGGGNSAETVLLNNIPAQEIVTNFDNIVQVVAGGNSMALSPGNVQVISDTGAITESANNVQYTYRTPGRVDNAMPMEGQNGTRITISGSHFHNGEGVDRILLAGVEAYIEDFNEDFLAPGLPGTFTVRAGRPSTPHSFSGPITIISHLNTMSISAFNFTYLSEGVIFSVTPNNGQMDTEVVLEGESLFGGGSTLQAVYLAGVMADMSGTPTDSRVTVIARYAPEPVTGDIVLISNTGAVVRRIDGWSYVQPGMVSDINPPQGQWGTRVTISGARLLSGGDFIERALLDDVELELSGSSPNSVQARIGQPQSTLSFNSSTVTLISNLGGTLRQNFSWIFLEQSRIISIDPQNGFGNEMVNILGSNLFGGGSSLASAEISSIPATLNEFNDSTVSLTTGFNFNGEALTGDIMLESDTGARTVLMNGWTYDRECPAGMYGNVDSCLPCDNECLACHGPLPTNCSICHNFRLENPYPDIELECIPMCFGVSTLEFVCQERCPLDTYEEVNLTEFNGNVTFCQNCNSQCDSNSGCSGPEANQCGGCANVLNILNQTCIESCPLDTYQDEQNECVPCNNQCATGSGCTGRNSTDCNQCANYFVTTTLFDGVIADSCVAECPSLYYLLEDRSLCAPCNNECLEGCSGPSPFDCVSCKGSSFEYPNGTTMCVPTCNPDPNRIVSYEDSRGVCLPCSTRCSLNGGCRGPTAFDCNGCRIMPGTNTTIPTTQDGECVNTCPNVNSTHSFYADNSTNQCESCASACVAGCIGPLATDCIAARSPVAAEAGAIAIFVIFLVILLLVVMFLVVFIVYQRKKGKLTFGENGDLELQYKNVYTSNTGDMSTRLMEESSQGANEATNKSLIDSELTASQDVLYTHMSSADSVMPPQDEPEAVFDGSAFDSSSFGVPPPKRDRKPVAEPPPQPVKPSLQKPPPALPEADEVYTDMESGSIQEVHVNPVADEEYTEMAVSKPTHPVVHQVEELYDDATSVEPIEKPAVPKEDQAPLLDDMGLYEDADTAIAQANEYKRITREEPVRESQRKVSDELPSLPQRAPPRKRPSQPLPQTPLQKSLSNTSVPTVSPAHQPPPISPSSDYTMMDVGSGPIEECLYEDPQDITGQPARPLPAQPPAQRQSSSNALPLPPRPSNSELPKLPMPLQPQRASSNTSLPIVPPRPSSTPEPPVDLYEVPEIENEIPLPPRQK